ncbi:MAG: DUF1743 domain-containing protein [Halobacteriaceae archaeon]
MTVVGVDDTDSRSEGMCTTFVGTEIANEYTKYGTVSRMLLIRLNPGVEHKTRGNAAVAIHTDVSPDRAVMIANNIIDKRAVTTDTNTNPGLVVFEDEPAKVPQAVASFTRSAIRDHLSIEEVENLLDHENIRHHEWGNGRGKIGATASLGAWDAIEDWTYEYIAYRKESNWGTNREVNKRSVFQSAEDMYPDAWDTIDRGEDEMVCVPHTPGPVLFGIRGDSKHAVKTIAQNIESEPTAKTALFYTNQGTDMHIQQSSLDSVANGRAYEVSGKVTTPPQTKEGGHVFFEITDNGHSLECAAFEPTKRFRDHVRKLRPGDYITVRGEVSNNTLKLEKFAVRELQQTAKQNPQCPSCGKNMKSQGADQGFRCRECETFADQKISTELDRSLELGWYEVPPCARRHIAKPLVRGGYDEPVHIER